MNRKILLVILSFALILSWGISNAINSDITSATTNFSASGIVAEISDVYITINDAKGSVLSSDSSYSLDLEYLKTVETSDYVPLKLSDIKVGDKIVAQGLTNGYTFFIKRIISFTSTPTPAVDENATSTEATSTASTTDSTSPSTDTTSTTTNSTTTTPSTPPTPAVEATTTATSTTDTNTGTQATTTESQATTTEPTEPQATTTEDTASTSPSIIDNVTGAVNEVIDAVKDVVQNVIDKITGEDTPPPEAPAQEPATPPTPTQDTTAPPQPEQ